MLLWLLATYVPPVVHTTGVNYEGALATASAVVVLLTPVVLLLGRAFQRSLKDTIKQEVEGVVAREVTPRFLEIEASQAAMQGIVDAHGLAIARLDGIAEGKRQAVGEASMTTVTAKDNRTARG